MALAVAPREPKPKLPYQTYHNAHRGRCVTDPLVKMMYKDWRRWKRPIEPIPVTVIPNTFPGTRIEDFQIVTGAFTSMDLQRSRIGVEIHLVIVGRMRNTPYCDEGPTP